MPRNGLGIPRSKPTRESCLLLSRCWTAILVYTTCATEDEARLIARSAVEACLAACANILPAHTALYRWEGRVEEGREVGMLLKTRKALFEQLNALIVDLHSYDCPCVVALSLEAGNPPYFDWLASSTEMV